MVQMRGLQDRCVANEGVIHRFWKRQEIENKEKDQCKEAVHALNTELMAKLALLKEETCRREEVEKANINLMIELATLCKQIDKVKADTVAAFWISQPFFEECGVFYGDKFDDCLKQVVVVYPDLGLSQVAIDDIVPPTPRGVDAISDETNDSAHTVEEEVKDPDAKVFVQPDPIGPAAPAVPSIYFKWSIYRGFQCSPILIFTSPLF